MKGSELAQAFFDGANARDWSAVAALHTDDHVYHDPQGPKPEPGGAGMAAHLAFYVEALEGRWEVREIVDAGTYVTARWTGTACTRATSSACPPRVARSQSTHSA